MNKYLLILIYLPMVSINCNSVFISKEPCIKAISVIYELPIVQSGDTISKFITKYEVYYYQDLTMYRNYYCFDSTLNGRSLLSVDRVRYFVYHKDSLYGMMYYKDNPHSMPEGRMPIDSMRNLITIQNTNYDNNALRKPDSSYVDSEGNLIKAFNHLPQPDNPENYTVYFYYTDKLKGITETFTEKMDNEKGRKLFKMLTKSKPFYYEKYKMMLPGVQILLEMKPLTIDNSTEIVELFGKYKRKT